jgi:hypothetical protein
MQLNYAIIQHISYLGNGEQILCGGQMQVAQAKAESALAYAAPKS